MGFVRIQDGGNFFSKNLWVNPARISECILRHGGHLYPYSNSGSSRHRVIKGADLEDKHFDFEIACLWTV